MKWMLIVLGVLVALVVVGYVVGMMSPKDHVATITVQVGKPDSVVFRVISDFAKVPEWFPEVKSSRRLPDVNGQAAYRENYGGFEVTNVVKELESNRKIVREILPEGAFSGTWTVELTPSGDHTTVTLTERGHVESPMFRAMMRFNDNHKTMRAWAAALGRKLGTTVTEQAAS